MKCSARVTHRLLTVSMIVFAVSVSTAQDVVETSTRVAEVDLGRLLKNEDAFRVMMLDIKASAQTFREESQTVGAKIKAKSDNLESASDEDRPKLEAQLQLAIQEFNAEKQELREELLDRESDAYRDAFVRISKAIATFAKENGFAAVRHKGKNGKPKLRDNDPRSVVTAAINSPYLYIDPQSDAVDITEDILGQLNQ